MHHRPTAQPLCPDRSRLTARHAVAVLTLVAGLASPLTAQTFEELETAERPEPVAVAPATAPETTQPVPGLTGGEDWFARVQGEKLDVPRPRLLPEGAFIVRRPGVIHATESGHRVWVPSDAAAAPGEGPMLLIPCLTLSRMEASLRGVDKPSVMISGEVFVYHERNYLLPTAFALNTTSKAEESPEDATKPMTAAGEDQTEGNPFEPPAGISDNPDIDELLTTLDQSLNDRGLTLPSVEGRAEAHTVGKSDVAEGVYLVRRRGRLIRAAGGAWTFTLDNDSTEADGIAPMVVVPCALLQRIEPRAQRQGDQLALTVSGRVYAYADRNYLVPTLMVEDRPNGITPRQ